MATGHGSHVRVARLYGLTPRETGFKASVDALRYSIGCRKQYPDTIRLRGRTSLLLRITPPRNDLRFGGYGLGLVLGTRGRNVLLLHRLTRCPSSHRTASPPAEAPHERWHQIA